MANSTTEDTGGKSEAGKTRLTFVNTELPVGTDPGDLRQIVLNFGDERFADPWQPVRLDGRTGEYSTNPSKDGWMAGWFCETAVDAFPSECPACDAQWAQRPDRITSPIRTMGTGYHKTNQLIIEQLMGSMFDATERSVPPRLVVFSDSRRDASQIAAELEQNHYKDSVRALTEEFLKRPGGDKADLKDFVERAPTMKAFELSNHPFYNLSRGDALRYGAFSTAN